MLIQLKEISKLSFITVKCHVNAGDRIDGSLSPTVNISTSLHRQLIMAGSLQDKPGIGPDVA